jgi:hypothetical protein
MDILTILILPVQECGAFFIFFCVFFTMSKEELDMDYRHVTSPTSLIMKELQLKTAMRYHKTPVRVVMIKITRANQCC